MSTEGIKSAGGGAATPPQPGKVKAALLRLFGSGKKLTVKKTTNESWPKGTIKKLFSKKTMSTPAPVSPIQSKKVSQDSRVRSSSVMRMTPGTLTERATLEVLPPGAAPRRRLSDPGPRAVAQKQLPEAQLRLVEAYDLQKPLRNTPIKTKLSEIFSRAETVRKANHLPREVEKQLFDMRVAINTLSFQSEEIARELAAFASPGKNQSNANDWFSQVIASNKMNPDKLLQELEEIEKSLASISKKPRTAKKELEQISKQCQELTTQMQSALKPLEDLSKKMKNPSAKPTIAPGALPRNDPVRMGAERRLDFEKSVRLESVPGALDEIFSQFHKLQESDLAKDLPADMLQKLGSMNGAISSLPTHTIELAKAVNALPEKYLKDAETMIALLDKIKGDPQNVLRTLKTIVQSLENIQKNPNKAKEELESIAKRCEDITKDAHDARKALAKINGALLLVTGLATSSEMPKERIDEISKKTILQQIRMLEDIAPSSVSVNLETLRSQWQTQADKAERDAPDHFIRDFPRQITTVTREGSSERFGQVEEGNAQSQIQSLHTSMVEGLKKGLEANPTFPTDPLTVNMLRYQLQNMWGQAIIAESAKELQRTYDDFQPRDYHALVKDEERSADPSKFSIPKRGSKERAKLDDLYRFEVEGSKIKLVGISYVCVPPRGKTLEEGIAGFDAVKVELTLDCAQLDPAHPTLLSRPGVVTITERRHGFREQFKDVTFDLDFHEIVTASDTDQPGGKSKKDIWDLAKEKPLAELRAAHSEAFLGDCRRIDVQINGEQILQPAQEKDADAAAKKVTEKLVKELAQATSTLPESSKFGERETELLRYEIEDIVGQWMDGVDKNRYENYVVSEKAQERSFSDNIPRAVLNQFGKKPGYTIEIKDGKVILTSTKYFQSTLIEESGKIHAYDAHLTEIIIDLAKVKPDLLLETPGCATVRDVWHGQVDSLDEISFEKPTFHETVNMGSEPLSKSWADSRKKFESMTAGQVASEHPPNFRIDCDRAVVKVLGKTLFSPQVLAAQKEKIIGFPLLEDEVVDESLHEKAKGNQLQTMSEAMYSGLHEVLPDDRFTEKEIHLLRYQVESMTNQWMYNFDKSANAAYFKGYVKQGKILSAQEKDFRSTGKQSNNYEIQIKDNKLIITNIVYHTVKDKKKMEQSQPAIEGFDAHRTQIVIDLSQVKPGELLLSEDCAKVTDSWHGFSEKLEGIEW